jgi:7-cyano-7-deazaguanine synthase
LSGGLDSTTLLALATQAGYAVNALTFRYGQRHGIEIERARAIAAEWRVARHVVADIDLRLFGGSALTADVAVPKDRDAAAMAEGSRSPTCRRATRSSSRSRSPGPRCSARRTC